MEEMEETIEPARPRRRLLWSAVILTLAAALVALTLSIYNTVRFDQRVHDYVTTHKALLAGQRGPQGPRGVAGPAGPAGPIGLPGRSVDLNSYDHCLEYELGRWLGGARVDISTIGVLPSGTLKPDQLYLPCS